MASAKAGRRANSSNAKTFDATEIDTDLMGSDFATEKPAKKKAAPAKSGWGAESDATEGEATTGFTESNADDGDDIPVIPELQSDATPVVDNVAIAPVVASRVATIGELANDLQKQASYSIIDGEIDISLIAKYIRGESEVAETDEVWEWDQVFAEVASDLRQASAVLDSAELTVDSKPSKADAEKEKFAKEKDREKEIITSTERQPSDIPATTTTTPAAPKGRRQKQPGQASSIFDD